MDQIFRQALISPDFHHVHVPDKIAIGKDKLRRKNLGAYLETLIQVRLIAVGNFEIAIAKEVFQLVRHRENHRVLRQSFSEHDRRAEVIVDERAAQMSESVGPFVDDDSVPGVDAHEIAGENARRREAMFGPHLSRKLFEVFVISLSVHLCFPPFRPGWGRVFP